MVKARYGNIMAFGLSDRNIELLKAGRPIFFELPEELRGATDVLILHGKTELDIAKELREAMVLASTEEVPASGKTQ